MPPLPTEYGDGREDLAGWGVGGEPTALTAGMEQQTAVGLQPLAEFFRIGGALAACGLTIGFEKEPGGTSTRALFVADGVVGAKPVIAAQSCNIMKTFHQIGGKGEQFFHLFSVFCFLSSVFSPAGG